MVVDSLSEVSVGTRFLSLSRPYSLSLTALCVHGRVFWWLRGRSHLVGDRTLRLVAVRHSEFVCQPVSTNYLTDLPRYSSQSRG